MSKGKNYNRYPAHYYRAATKNAERRYLKERKTKAAVLTEKRQKVVEILSKYIQLSLVRDFRATQEQINEVGAEVDALSRWYQGIIDTQGEKRAAMLLKQKAEGFLPPNYWMPSNIAFSEDEMAAARQAGDLTAKIWCVAVHKVCGLEQKALIRLLDNAKKIYRHDREETEG